MYNKIFLLLESRFDTLNDKKDFYIKTYIFVKVDYSLLLIPVKPILHISCYIPIRLTGIIFILYVIILINIIIVIT